MKKIWIIIPICLLLGLGVFAQTQLHPRQIDKDWTGYNLTVNWLYGRGTNITVSGTANTTAQMRTAINGTGSGPQWNISVWYLNGTALADIDTDTFNTTTQMRTAINSTGVGPEYNITVKELEGTDFGTLTDAKWCVYDLANTEVDCNVEPVSDTDTFNTTAQMQAAVNSSEYLYNIKINCSDIQFDTGYGASAICDGADASAAGGGNSSTEMITATNISKNFAHIINWTQLQEYPAACPAGSFITQLGDSVTCTTDVDTTNCSTEYDCTSVVYAGNTSWITANQNNDGNTNCSTEYSCVDVMYGGNMSSYAQLSGATFTGNVSFTTKNITVECVYFDNGAKICGD